MTRRANHNLVEIDVVIRRETDRAWGLAADKEPGVIVWIPKSMCEIEWVSQVSKTALMTLEEDFAQEKGLI